MEIRSTSPSAKLSRRISLSPFPTLQHHSGTIPGPSITFQAFPPHSIKLLPFQFTPFLTPSPPSTFPSFTTVSGITVSLRNSPFLSVPVSLRYSPFLSVHRFCPPFSVSTCTPFLSSRSPFLPGSQLDKAVHQMLLLADILCLATSPYISISFPYISQYTLVVWTSVCNQLKSQIISSAIPLLPN